MRTNGAVKGLVMVMVAGAALALVLTAGYYVLIGIGAALSWCLHTAIIGPRVLGTVGVLLLFVVPPAIASASDQIGMAWRDAARRRAQQRRVGQRRA